MRKYLYGILNLLAIYFFGLSCTVKPTLESKVRAELSKTEGRFAVAFKDLTTGDTLFINADSVFHAASTMKTPVMAELFRQAGEGRFSLTDSIIIKNEFKSIVDGSPYSLSRDSDSDTLIYERIGKKESIMNLMTDMIIVSSNLATNILIDMVGAKRVDSLLIRIGAPNMHVLRGVEDTKAFEAGLNNTTSARGQLLLYELIATNRLVDVKASEEMIRVLSDQRFGEIIPARLPKDVTVAHKTGSITGVQHDGGIVMLPDGRKYILVLLASKLKDPDKGVETMAMVSELIYRHVTGNQNSEVK
jgi:beta-lactamase class A